MLTFDARKVIRKIHVLVHKITTVFIITILNIRILSTIKCFTLSYYYYMNIKNLTFVKNLPHNCIIKSMSNVYYVIFMNGL